MSRRHDCATRWSARDPRWLETPPYQFPPLPGEPITYKPVNWWRVALYLAVTTGIGLLAIKALAVCCFGRPHP